MTPNIFFNQPSFKISWPILFWFRSSRPRFFIFWPPRKSIFVNLHLPTPPPFFHFSSPINPVSKIDFFQFVGTCTRIRLGGQKHRKSSKKSPCESVKFPYIEKERGFQKGSIYTRVKSRYSRFMRGFFWPFGVILDRFGPILDPILSILQTNTDFFHFFIILDPNFHFLDPIFQFLTLQINKKKSVLDRKISIYRKRTRISKLIEKTTDLPYQFAILTVFFLTF